VATAASFHIDPSALNVNNLIKTPGNSSVAFYTVLNITLINVTVTLILTFI